MMDDITRVVFIPPEAARSRSGERMSQKNYSTR